MISKKYLLLNSIPLIFSLLITFTILVFFKKLPPSMPLFYSLSWGKNELANHEQFFVIPLVIVLITLINYVISWQLHQSQDFFKKILLGFSLVTTVILFITFIKIILIFT